MKAFFLRVVQFFAPLIMFGADLVISSAHFGEKAGAIVGKVSGGLFGIMMAIAVLAFFAGPLYLVGYLAWMVITGSIA